MLGKIELKGYTIIHGHLIFGHRLWLRWGESYSTVATEQNENPVMTKTTVYLTIVRLNKHLSTFYENWKLLDFALRF